MRFAPATALGMAILAAVPCAAAIQTRPVTSHTAIDGDERAYRALLTKVLANDVITAVNEVLATDFETLQRQFRRTLERVAAETERLGKMRSEVEDVPLRRARADRLQVLKTAALLHTVAAIKVATYDPSQLEEQHWLAHEAVAELFKLRSDFDRFGPVRRTQPTANGRAAAPSKRATASDWPEVRAFVRLWYLVVAARLQDVASFDLLAKTFAWGLERFRDDPELLLGRGSMYEAKASLILVDRSVAVQIYMPDALSTWRGTLAQAEADFADARHKDPTLVEATLRWGRTRLLAGDEKDAARAFANVLKSRAPAWMLYLALVFDGARAEAEKKLDQARAAYRQALAVVPGAAPALLGLSRIADKAGDRASAREWAAQSLRRSPEDTEPWGLYITGQSDQLEERFAAFERLALQ